MKKSILALLIASIYLTGCSEQPSDHKSQKTAEATAARENNIGPAKFDAEAATLGFPEKFISKEGYNADWSQAADRHVSGMDVQIYDTGATVDVCGGIGCDK